MTEKDGYSLKIILIGDGGAGKTSLINQFVHKKFSSIYKTTIGVDITPYQVDVEKSGESIRFMLWDLSGQRHFARFRSRFYAGTSGALVVYDLTNAPSYLNVPIWVKECHDNTSRKVPVIIVGNKADLTDLQIHQTKPPMSESGYPSLVTSAKTNLNVDEAFFVLFEKIVDRKLVKKPDQSIKTTHVSYDPSLDSG
ncbi:MAG: Rab family GTPase [Candidatus Hodarchaeota archaeon]